MDGKHRASPERRLASGSGGLAGSGDLQERRTRLQSAEASRHPSVGDGETGQDLRVGALGDRPKWSEDAAVVRGRVRGNPQIEFLADSYGQRGGRAAEPARTATQSMRFSSIDPVPRGRTAGAGRPEGELPRPGHEPALWISSGRHCSDSCGDSRSDDGDPKQDSAVHSSMTALPPEWFLAWVAGPAGTPEMRVAPGCQAFTQRVFLPQR